MEIAQIHVQMIADELKNKYAQQLEIVLAENNQLN